MNSTIEILDTQSLREILGYDLRTNLCLSTTILIILAFGTIVQKQLYSFLKTRNKRLVNKIILLNVLIQNIIYPIILCYHLLAIWVQDLSYYISDYGCFALSLILQFSGLFDRSVSFFINLFRYICIVHDDYLKKHDIHPKVSLHNSNLHIQRMYIIVIAYIFTTKLDLCFNAAEKIKRRILPSG